MGTGIVIFLIICAVVWWLGEWAKNAEAAKRDKQAKEQAELLRRIADAAEKNPAAGQPSDPQP